MRHERARGGTGRWRRRWLAAAALAALGLVAPPASADGPPGFGTCAEAGGVVTCEYAMLEATQFFAVPDGVSSVRVTLLGGAGGDSAVAPDTVTRSAGGRGASVSAVVPVSPGEFWVVMVGGRGVDHTGGFNGGGELDAPGTFPRTGGGGGGASDIRSFPSQAEATFDLAARIVVAAGGGGAGGYAYATDARGQVYVAGGRGADSGADGGSSGGGPTGNVGGTRIQTGGRSGQLVAGGAGGQLGDVPVEVSSTHVWQTFGSAIGSRGGAGGFATGGQPSVGVEPVGGIGGGGGGGWYGGGAGATGGVWQPIGEQWGGSGGGGGSSYAAARLQDVSIEQGVNAGDGRVTISYATPGAPIAPTFTTAPSGVTAPADAGCTASDVAAPTYAVAGSPAPTISFEPPLAGPFRLGSTTVTATAANGVGTAATATFPVTVVDETPPTFGTPPADASVETTSATGATVSYATPAASDNCPGMSVARTGGPASGALFPVGTTRITHVATDGAGRTAEVSFDVTVRLVEPTPLTIRADDARVAYGAAVPAFTATAQGLRDGDALESLDGTLRCAAESPATLPPPGSYPIRCTGLSSSRYTIGYVDGTLTVVAPARARALTIDGRRLAVVTPRSQTIPLTCSLDQPGLTTCTVRLIGTVAGRTTTLATTTATAIAPGASPVAVALPVSARLRALALRPGGITLDVAATARQAGHDRTLRATTTAMLVPGLPLYLPSDAIFRGRSTRLPPAGTRLLRVLRSASTSASAVTCTGATDARGPSRANYRLALARARAVCSFITAGSPAAPHATSLGETHPRVPNTSAANRAKNRYVAVTISFNRQVRRPPRLNPA